MGTHARLSPSNHRWPKCPGSVELEAQYPDVANDAAIDGTGTHLLLELCLNNDYVPDHYEGQIIGIDHESKLEGWLIQKDRIERVWMCLNYIHRRKAELQDQFPGASITVQEESRADPGSMFNRTDWYGTCDITIEVIQDNRCLFVEIIDYKDGFGWVHVENNSQLISYAGGKIHHWIASGNNSLHPERIPYGVRTSIVQPKTKIPVRYYDYSTAEIVDALRDLARRAMLTDMENAPLIPGKHCQWCAHRTNCTALADESLQAIKKSEIKDMVESEDDDNEYNGYSLMDLVKGGARLIAQLDSQRLVELVDIRAGIEAVFDLVEKELVARLNQGQQVNGYTLRPGRPTRCWNMPEEDMVEVLQSHNLKLEDIYLPKLVSPAQIMKNPNLTDDQKKYIDKQYVMVKYGDMRLTKVEHSDSTNDSSDMFDFVSVAQPATDVVPSFL